MLNRRQVLLTASAAACLAEPVLAKTPPTIGSNPREAAKLRALFDDFMQGNLKRSPELATSLGLDKGPLAAEKSLLDDRSLASRTRDKTENLRRQTALATVSRSTLVGKDALGHDTIAYIQDQQAEADLKFDYGGVGSGSPYVISQLTGAYQSIPDFLDTQHSIETKADADAYLARLDAFAEALDQEIEQVQHDAAMGVAPPAFIVDRTLQQMAAFSRTPANQSTLVTSVAHRAALKGITGDYQSRASTLYTNHILPALNRQMELLTSLRLQGNRTPGVASLPNGGAYYAASLQSWTTTELPPAEVHRMGLEQVASLTGQLDAAFKAQGMSQGAVWERLRALFADPKFLYPNTDAGKAKLIGELNDKVKAVQAKLPAWFGTLPKAGVEIRRVPPAIEAGASSNYQSGALDGSRPGAYYIVLRDTAEDPSWVLPTLTYHESIPGHHLQGTLQHEADLPMILKTSWFSAYGEGWALYAEQLAGEMGMYDDDPFGHIGYLHDALLRAARMVMDSGLHSMGWSREQAIKYFVENQGDPESAATSEVERYCVWPGQACSYMVGKLEWLRLREKAKTVLGPKFDIRRFHDAGLLNGCLPLTVLSSAIDGYVRSASAA